MSKISAFIVAILCVAFNLSAAARVLAVDAVQLKQKDSYQYKQQYAGRIKSQNITDLGFELGSGVTGTLIGLAVDVGDKFKKGQVLARLDDRIQQQRLLQLQAQLKQTQADLTLAKANTQRMIALQKKHYASKQGYDRAIAKEQGLTWKIAALKAQIEQATISLKKLTLEAPFDGVVSNRYLSLGAHIQGGQRVLQILDNASYQVNIGVPVRYLSYLKPGQPVMISIDDKQLPGKIKSISTHRNPETKSHNVLITTAFKNGVFIPNQAMASIELMVRVKQPGAWVPITALQQNYRGLWSLYGLKPQGEGKYRVVRHYARIYFADETKAYVATDLHTGTWVISDGLLRIVPGETVTIEPEKNVTLKEKHEDRG